MNGNKDLKTISEYVFLFELSKQYHSPFSFQSFHIWDPSYALLMKHFVFPYIYSFFMLNGCSLLITLPYAEATGSLELSI